MEGMFVDGLVELNLASVTITSSMQLLPIGLLLPNLRCFSLSNCRNLHSLAQVVEAWVAKGSKCLKSLQAFDLSGCNAIEPEDVLSLKAFTNLHYLSLSRYE